ncbi:myeloid-derived growth factor isoform X1 [Phocoena sinus]|uniref:Myeloid derived growth factor n=1 Tax=Phocoena sinus TaxID=42100 RepID=A0A8C9C932_PHOSS|nr:myeloid-derived growth factor isoform X1 [Phocoena sinus]
MAAPSRRRNGGGGAVSLWAALLLVAVALRPARAVSEPTTVAFDVRPGGVVHSFSQNVGPGDKYTCVFTYASQGGTNELEAEEEKWQMSLGTSEDQQHFTCTIWRPQGKSYLYFTQFKVEVRGAEIEYGMAYSKAAFERESDVPLKNEEFEVTKTAVSHRPGAFKAELSKLVIVAKATRSEL